jgi:hypothetical protein
LSVVTLAEHVDNEGPLKVRDAIGWVARAALAVDELHTAGMPHGRISAAAIVMEARDCQSGGSLLPPSESPESPLYHSLDRIDGQGPSAADDVWALGVTLYFALTGHYPYPEGIERNIRDNRLRPPTAVAFHRAELDVMQRVIDRTTIPGHPMRAVSMDALVAELAELSPSVLELPALEVNINIAAEEEVQVQAQVEQEATAKRAVQQEQLKKYAPWAALVVLVSALLIWRVMVSGEETAAPAPVTASSTRAKPTPTRRKPPKPAPSKAQSSAAPSASQASAAPPVSDGLRDADLVACTAQIFPPDAFRKGKVRADFPCREVELKKALRVMAVELVRGGGGKETQATRLWVRLGWYRLGLFAVARAHCCNNPPPLTTHAMFDSCGLNEALEGLTKASMGDGDSGVLKALDAFYKSARCAHNHGGVQIFGIEQQPGGQQQAVFLSILTKLRESK